MTYHEYLKVASESYYDFIELLNIELDSLEKSLRNDEIIKDESLRFKDSISSINKVLENKDMLSEMNSELKDNIELLEFLNKKNNLDNAAAIEAFDKIVNNEYLLNRYKVSPEIDNNINKYKQEINAIKNILDGKYDFESLNKVLDHYNFDKESKTKIIFGFVLKQNNLLVDKAKKEINEETLAENNYKNKFIKEEENAIDEKLLEKYNNALNIYRQIQIEYDDLFKEYYNKYKSNPSNKLYDSYALQGIEYIYNNLDLSDEELSLVLYKKLFNVTEDVNESIGQLNIDNPKRIDYETIIFYIEEFEETFKEFIKISKLLNEKNTIDKEDKSKVYFIHDENNNVLIPNIKSNIKKVHAFMSKADIGALESKNLKVNRLLGVDNEEKYLSKMIFMLNNNISITYIKLNNGGTYILSVGPAEEIKDYTKETIYKYGDIIREEIELLENENIGEINKQSIIRMNIKNLHEMVR